MKLPLKQSLFDSILQSIEVTSKINLLLCHLWFHVSMIKLFPKKLKQPNKMVANDWNSIDNNLIWFGACFKISKITKADRDYANNGSFFQDSWRFNNDFFATDTLRLERFRERTKLLQCHLKDNRPHMRRWKNF